MNLSPTDKTPKTKRWKENVAKLLFRTNVCGVCLSEKQELNNLNNVYHIEKGNKEKSLKYIIDITFGHHVTSMLPTKYICSQCVTTILQSYFMTKKIRTNHSILQKYVDILTEQVSISSETEKSIEKQLLLTIDNVDSLNVPTAVTVTNKEKQNNITQIFLCEVNDLDTDGTEFDVKHFHMKYECPYCGKQFHEYCLFKDHYKLHNDVYYRCYKCSKRYKYFEEFIKHRKSMHSDNLTICEICQIILLSPESCEHETEHAEKRINSSYEINSVSQSALVKNKSENVDVTCQKCLKTFQTDFKLEHHRCPYKCFECKDECVHEEFLASYREQHMIKAGDLKCPQCDFTYLLKTHIICHANEKHLNHLPYLCDLCGESFASRTNLTTHINKKHADISDIFDHKSVMLDGPIVASVLSERPYECHSCGFCFNSEESYTAHRRKHLTEETKCRFCDKSFCSIGQMNIHIKKKHPDEITNRNIIYQCTMCPVDFQFRTEYIKHVESHPIGTNHVCRQCNKIIPTKKNYISHVRKHRIPYDKHCPICLKKYTKKTLSRHLRLHSFESGEKEASLICDVCAAVLPDEKALIKHAMKHTEKRECPHCQTYVNSVLYSKHVKTHLQPEKQIKSCSECSYTTKFGVCLEAHINRHHLKVRPYKCDLCLKQFYSDYTLRGHLTTHKDERPEHFCHICGKKFISKKAVVFHTRIHTGEQPYPCDFCDLRFLSSSRKRQHMIRKHFDPTFECQLCGKKLYTKSDLRRHIGDCHDGESKRNKIKRSDIQKS